MKEMIRLLLLLLVVGSLVIKDLETLLRSRGTTLVPNHSVISAMALTVPRSTHPFLRKLNRSSHDALSVPGGRRNLRSNTVSPECLKAQDTLDSHGVLLDNKKIRDDIHTNLLEDAFPCVDQTLHLWNTKTTQQAASSRIDCTDMSTTPRPTSFWTPLQDACRRTAGGSIIQYNVTVQCTVSVSGLTSTNDNDLTKERASDQKTEAKATFAFPQLQNCVDLFQCQVPEVFDLLQQEATDNLAQPLQDYWMTHTMAAMDDNSTVVATCRAEPIPQFSHIMGPGHTSTTHQQVSNDVVTYVIAALLLFCGVLFCLIVLLSLTVSSTEPALQPPPGHEGDQHPTMLRGGTMAMTISERSKTSDTNHPAPSNNNGPQPLDPSVGEQSEEQSR